MSEVVMLDSALITLIIGLVIISLMTYAGIKDSKFMLLSGISWMGVAILLFVPYSETLGMFGVFIGLIISLWGVVKLVL
jgi:hypothetical protein